ncbi:MULTISPECIES: hypothetical protein [unclassified Streptomyces]|uniref:hypothetical protein n=1 Tax=unclassified Streptomyces TaxID=2593676 RepID=UPI001F049002|nr:MULTISPECIES: hypothetical protein [unclassified Streptomyces]MCH0565317.1 hypothetical protein [Streptomyces sp. MUM 2J]MCH0570862.1 hypothetical protein [Streptomyces sp. MUM 136J]
MYLIANVFDECHEEACRKVDDRRDQLDAPAEALPEHETLEEAGAYRIAGVTRPVEDTEA